MAWISEVLHTSSRTITSMSIVIAFLVMAGGWVWERMISPAVENELKTTLGISEIADGVEVIGAEVAAQSVQIDRIGRQIKAITPEPVVAEYDPLRSRALEPCVPGQEVCQVLIRSRRTPFGETCDTPTITSRTFVDALGTRTHPIRRTPSSPRSIDGDWSSVTIDFSVPARAEPGIGEYWITLEYTGCWAEDVDGERIDYPPLEQDSIAVPVQIVG